MVSTSQKSTILQGRSALHGLAATMLPNPNGGEPGLVFYEMANLVAKKSKDQSTQIGAVIVGPDNEIRSTGYNSFPCGINDDLQERQERPEKYYWIEHAERNALYLSLIHI